ncbi:MAG: DUF3604 domain-containing protein [Burkholderiales bacterium]|nr:DUF3604 domain-containing protein [Burkholderiales bacterium]
MSTRNSHAALFASIALAFGAMHAHAQERHAYFGQTHQHTSWSLDAYILGNTLTGPEDSYRYAMGEPIKHPAGFDVKIKAPLDFMMVTDHSEYVGMVRLANDPSSPVSKLPIAARLRVTPENPPIKIFQWLAGSLGKNEPIKELLQPDLIQSVWEKNNAAAEKYNKPGKFTTFCAYEWTSMPKNQNMHRNILFKECSHVPGAPFSAIDSEHPEDLWNWMDAQRKSGNALIAISHNGNLSNGLMFPIDVDSKGKPIDAAWAEQRMRNEPIHEIKQVKGASETTPLLSPNDEFAGFELMNYLIGLDNSFSRIHGSYVREADLNGLALQATRGFNPYKLGVVGAGDSHNTATAYSQSNFFGDHGLIDSTPEKRLSGEVASGMTVVETGTSGLGGVWAESNTREAIFDAFRRREVFATSGVRLQVRMFGGWGYDRRSLDGKDWAKAAYKQGVPMGGDLPAHAGNKAPTFIVWATKDPQDGNLDRIQIVKGWTKNGQTFEKIYDVAWSGNRKVDRATGKLPPVGNTVDVAKATYRNDIGAVELKAAWADPDFDPSLHAFYYARVLQIPTPRWSTFDAAKLGVPPPSTVPATVQERAWGSPIWYTPTQAQAAKAPPGVTVADLKRSGATALTDAELKALVLGKTVKLRDTVGGNTLYVLFGLNGERVVTLPKGTTSNVLGTPKARYEIKDGRIVVTQQETPFGLTVYRSGGKYIAARSNEFGYANYEVQSIER